MLNRTLGSITAGALLVLGACGAESNSHERAQLDVQAQGSEQEQALDFLPVPGDLGLLNEIAAKTVGQVQLDNLATKHSNSPLVREYAEYMENYSNSLLVAVENLATEKGASIQAEMTLRDQFHYGRLEYRYGAYFDDKYLSYQAEDADRSISQIREGYEASIDPDVRALAQSILADLQDVAVLLQSVENYRGSSNDVAGTFATLVAQTTLGQNGDKGGKTPGKSPGQDPGQIPGSGQGQDSGQIPGKAPGAPSQIPGKGLVPPAQK